MKAIFPLNHGRLDVLIGLLGAGEEREDNWRIGMRDKLNVMIGFLTVKSNEEIRDVLIPVSPSRYRSDTSASSRKEKEEAYSLKTSSSSHCLINLGGAVSSCSLERRLFKCLISLPELKTRSVPPNYVLASWTCRCVTGGAENSSDYLFNQPVTVFPDDKLFTALWIFTAVSEAEWSLLTTQNLLKRRSGG